VTAPAFPLDLPSGSHGFQKCNGYKKAHRVGGQVSSKYQMEIGCNTKYLHSFSAVELWLWEVDALFDA
jgi:hypothetical protein